MRDRPSIVERYIITLRIIQPARVQDIFYAYLDLWDAGNEPNLKGTIYAIHEKLKSEGRLASIRRGTYALTPAGMELAGSFMKEREIDNRRLYLMKHQRKLYH